MSRSRFTFLIGLALLAGGLMAGSARAQNDDPPFLLEKKPADHTAILTNILQTTIAEALDGSRYQASPRGHRNNVKIGQNVTVSEGEEVRDVVVVSGNAQVDGTVNGDLVVIIGQITLGPKAVVRRQLVSIAGVVKADPAAVVRGDVVVIGGVLDAETNALIYQARNVITPEFDFSKLAWVKEWQSHFPKFKMGVDWLREGLLLARPLPPQFGWVWAIAAVLLFIHLLIAVMFPRPVLACVSALDRRPIGSFFTGLLVLLLLVPVLVLLVVTGVGILAVPFLLGAAALGLVFGKIAVYRHAGEQFGRQFNLAGLQQPLVALLLGTLLIYLLYVIPFIGFLTWGALTVLGLGNATIAAFGGMRRDPETANPGAANLTSPAPAATLLEPAAWARAGFWRRFTAMALDFVLVLVVGLLSIYLVREVFHFQRLSPPPLLLMFWLAYHVGLWALTGTTLGGMVMRIKLVREDGRPIGPTLALVRALASVFSAIVFCFGFFWAGWTRGKRSWHDLIAGTLMVKIPRGVPAV